MAGEVIGRSGVFEEDDTTFCFLVISNLQMSPGFAVGNLSDAMYSVVLTDVSMPNWSTLSVCRSSRGQQPVLLPGGWYYIPSSVMT
jgi:CheY-like chemotaxis protein